MALSGLSFLPLAQEQLGAIGRQLVVSWIFRFVTFFTDFLDKLGQGLSNLYLNGQPALSGLLPIPLK